MPHVFFRTFSAVIVATAALSGCILEDFRSGATAPVASRQGQVATSVETTSQNRPSLIVTNAPPPNVVYRNVPSETSSADIKLPSFSSEEEEIETLVTRKAQELTRDVSQLGREVETATAELQRLQVKNDLAAAEYYAVVASINTELQSGTTPGNPILVNRWNMAQGKLNALSQDAGVLNVLATDLSNQATRATYLLEATQNAFALSGAVKEDHKKLTVIEDEVNQNITLINRQLVKTNDEITRRITYLRTERANLQTLFLGITNGELYGQSLTNSLFKKATGAGQGLFKPDSLSAPSPAPAASPSTRRPLVIIRFDRPNVNYDQPLYSAVSQALEKYPSARFELVAVSNMEGNPAQLALSSAEARKNGALVLRSLTQMGLPIERIHLSAANSKDVVNSEVHIYLK